jgi:hypothetical protein
MLRLVYGKTRDPVSCQVLCRAGAPRWSRQLGVSQLREPSSLVLL